MRRPRRTTLRGSIPAPPYTAAQSNPVTYDVDFAAVVTAPNHTKVLKVWLPLPQTDSAQQVVEKGLSTFPMQVEPQIGKEKVFGNQFAYFEFIKPEGAQMGAPPIQDHRP